VRIGNNSPNPNSDFARFMDSIYTTKQGKWDKDHKGKITTGDYIGFITGPNGNEHVYIFKVIAELPLEERESWWTSNAYTENNGISGTSNRIPILLTDEHGLPPSWDW
jgi:hypothetical protein